MYGNRVEITINNKDMETLSPKSLEEFSEIFDYYNNGENYYRGQADYLWGITPGLARNISIKNSNEILRIESKLIEKFSKSIRDNKLESLIPKVDNYYNESWIIHMAAQHYGLPTRFLDFSNDIFTSLEFAVADMQNLNKHGALIIYKDVNSIQVDFSIFGGSFKNIYNKSFFLQVPSIYNPAEDECMLSEHRKIIQGSKFLYRDTSNLFECLSFDRLHSERLIKIIIPHEFKLEIIKYLVKIHRMAYDLFAGKNALDHFAAILKLGFSKLDESKIDDYLKSDNL
jgi:hypothetical protein